MCTTVTDRKLDGDLLLVGHCLALGTPPERAPAYDRLEAVLGAALAHRLVFALTRPADA